MLVERVDEKVLRQALSIPVIEFFNSLPDALIEFFGTGDDALSRDDVVKRMWKYIKEDDLQDPADRRQITCDDKLNKLFNIRSFTGFTILKLLSAHFVKTDK